MKLFGSIDQLRDEKLIMSSQIRIVDLLSIYRIDSEVNRDISYNRLPKITNYIDSHDSSHGIYFPAIVCSMREDIQEHYDIDKEVLNIPHGVKLVVLDGQHRIKALESYLSNEMVDVEKRNAIYNSYLTVQLYFNLTAHEEKNLFADINSKSKRVSMSLVTRYDTREIMNVLVVELFEMSKALKNLDIEFVKSRIVRPSNKSFCTSNRLIKVLNNILFNKEALNNKEKELVKNNYDDILFFLDKLFNILISVFPEDPADVIKYVLGHEELQNAIGKYINKEIMSFENDKISLANNWELKIEELKEIDWSVKWEQWQPYMYSARINSPFEYKSFIENTELELLEILQKHAAITKQ